MIEGYRAIGLVVSFDREPCRQVIWFLNNCLKTMAYGLVVGAASATSRQF